MRQLNAGSWGRAIRTLGTLGFVSAQVACVGGAGVDAPKQATVSAPRPIVGQITPVRLDRDKLAGLGLEEYPAFSTDLVLEGGYEHRGHVFFMGDEIVVEVWEADASKLAITEPFPYDEFVTILSGKLILTDQQGTVVEYSAGESLVVPKGFTGTWHMVGNYRELVVIEKEAYVREEGSE